MGKVIGITVSVLLVALSLIGVSMYFSYNNQDAKIRAQAEAQRGKIEGVHDKMWKTLQQKAQVTDEYKDAFKEIYPALIEGRYSQGDGSMMKWITEANPDFDTSLYKDITRCFVSGCPDHSKQHHPQIQSRSKSEPFQTSVLR